MFRSLQCKEGEAGVAAKPECMLRRRDLAFAALVAGALGAPAQARAAGAGTAALQGGLRARGLYAGTIDGLPGPGTRTAVVRLQRRAGLAVDGVAGPATRRALGWRGRPPIGTRALRGAQRGRAVA